MNTAKLALLSATSCFFVLTSLIVKADTSLRWQERDYKGHVIHKTKNADNKTVDAQGAIMHESGKVLGRVPKDGKHYDRVHGIFILKYGEHPYQPFAPMKGSGASVYQFVTGKQ